MTTLNDRIATARDDLVEESLETVREEVHGILDPAHQHDADVGSQDMIDPAKIMAHTVTRSLGNTHTTRRLET